MTERLKEFLQPGPCVDSEHPHIVDLARDITESGRSERENAVALYYYVRDSFRYNPYALGATQDDWRASEVLKTGEGWCVPKAVLLAALCRASGIPARLGFADVVNHLSTERMRASMETDVFYYHGYCSIFLDGQWVKATPAFNLSLCEKFGLQPLEFDGANDSLYHEFDQAGNRHMEYVSERGEFADVPYEDIIAVFKEHYPKMMATGADSGNTEVQALDPSEWEADVEKEMTPSV